MPDSTPEFSTDINPQGHTPVGVNQPASTQINTQGYTPVPSPPAPSQQINTQAHTPIGVPPPGTPQNFMNDPRWQGPPPYDANPPFWKTNPPPYTIYHTQDTTVPDICCIGFNPEDSRLEAIIKVPVGINNFEIIEDKKLIAQLKDGNATTMVSKTFCSDGVVARMGFWIKLAGSLYYCGEGDVNLTNEPNANLIDQNDPYIYYAIHQHLIPDLQVTDQTSKLDFWSAIAECTNGPVIAELWCALKITERDDYQTFTWSEVTPPGVIPVVDHLSGTSLNPIDPLKDFNNINNPKLIILKKLIQFPKISSFGKFDFTLRSASNAVPVESQVFPMHAVLLKNKKVLLFSGSGNISYKFDDSDPSKNLPPPNLKHTVALFDPDSETIQEISAPPSYADLSFKEDGTDVLFKGRRFYDVFCAGHSALADGRVIVLGGTEEYGIDNAPPVGGGANHTGHFPGVKIMAIFDPDTATWNLINTTMKSGRWYPSTLVLSDGNVFILGGHPELASGFHTNPDLEIFNPYISDDPQTPQDERWVRQVPEVEPTIENTFINKPTNQILSGTYPKLFLLPNGQVFSSSLFRHIPPTWDSSKMDKGIKISEDNPAIIRWYPYWDSASNPNQLWAIVNRGKIGGNLIKNTINTKDTGNPATANGGYHVGNDTFSEPAVLLPLLAAENYDPAIMILKFQTSFTCRPLSANPEWVESGRGLTSGNIERLNGNAVLLPDATVLFIGGVQSQSSDAHLNPHPQDNPGGVLPIEIFDPTTAQWSVGANVTRPRNYHSVAVLLYDGRVLLAASDVNADGELFSQDLSYDIYTPDCLFRGPRPIFSVSHEVVTYGDKINIRLAKGWKFDDIDHDKVGLIRCYAATHAFGFDQRYVNLKTISGNTGDVEFIVHILSNSNIIPPGYYYLFLVSKAGAPSLGHVIQIINVPPGVSPIGKGK